MNGPDYNTRVVIRSIHSHERRTLTFAFLLCASLLLREAHYLRSPADTIGEFTYRGSTASRVYLCQTVTGTPDLLRTVILTSTSTVFSGGNVILRRLRTVGFRLALLCSSR